MILVMQVLKFKDGDKLIDKLNAADDLKENPVIVAA